MAQNIIFPISYNALKCMQGRLEEDAVAASDKGTTYDWSAAKGQTRGVQKENAKPSADAIESRMQQAKLKHAQTGARAAGQVMATPMVQIGGTQPARQAAPAAATQQQFAAPFFAPFGLPPQVFSGLFTGVPGMAPLGMLTTVQPAPFPAQHASTGPQILQPMFPPNVLEHPPN